MLIILHPYIFCFPQFSILINIGVSRRSVSLYESGSSATIDIYLKLESILKGDISRNINVSITEEPSMPVNVGNDFINEVLNMIDKLKDKFEIDYKPAISPKELLSAIEYYDVVVVRSRFIINFKFIL